MTGKPEWRWFLATLLAVDTIALFIAFSLAYIIRFAPAGWPPTFGEDVPTDAALYLGVVALLLPIWLGVFAAMGLYSQDNLIEGPREYQLVVHVCTYGFVAAAMVAFFVVRDPWISRGWLVLSWVLSIVLVGSARFWLRRVVYALRSRGLFVTRVVIAGANEQGKAIAQQLTPVEHSGVAVVGFADDYLPPGARVIGDLRVLTDTMQIGAYARGQHVDEIIVVQPAISWDGVNELIALAQRKDSTLVVRFSPGLYDVLGTDVRVSRRGAVPLVTLDKTRITGLDAVVKRATDWGLAIAGLIALAPLALLIMASLKVIVRGPIFARRAFLGRSGEHYDQWVFATARLSRLGFQSWWTVLLHRLLIAGGLMYYPSLINVLRRELSFVGPRPSTSDELARCYPWGENLLTLRPGLTGPWWLGGKDKLTIEQRVQLDLSYLRNYSIWLDLQILYQTILKLMARFVRPDDDQRPPPIHQPKRTAVTDPASSGVGQAMGA